MSDEKFELVYSEKYDNIFKLLNRNTKFQK